MNGYDVIMVVFNRRSVERRVKHVSTRLLERATLIKVQTTYTVDRVSLERERNCISFFLSVSIKKMFEDDTR